MKNKKALYFFMGKSSFVEKDIAIFNEYFNTLTFNFEFGKKWKLPFQLLHQLIFLIRNVSSSKFCIIQLSGLHAFLPTLIFSIFNKKSIIIAAGTDCHSFPSIGYGNYQRTLLAWATRFSFKRCSMILPKHQSLWHTDYTYDNNDFSEQGIAYFNKGLKKPYFCIENGFDGTTFKKLGPSKPNSFITIAGLLNRPSQQKLKGIDLIIEAAKQFPESSFTIIGGVSSYFESLPRNITLISKTPNNELSEILSRHKYYLQLSMAEGFPNALCEAMLCECTPIGSNVFSIPEIIGSTGYILKKRNKELLFELIRSLPENDSQKNGIAARERIINNYTPENRKKKFKYIFENLELI